MTVHVRTRRESLSFANARLVMPDGVAERGSLLLAGGRIGVVEPEAVPADAIDCQGDVLMPGIVDVHTDHVEKHVFPRSHVRWQALPAALAHDAQMIGGGITTVFDSLCVGIAGFETHRREILTPMIEAIEAGTAAGMFKAEHFVHLRCETADEATIALLADHLDCALVRIASVMDHTPGVKQSRDLEGYIVRRIAATGWERPVVEAELKDTVERLAGVVERVRHDVVALLRRSGLTLMSHDDVTAAHIAEAKADGVTVAEFPPRWRRRGRPGPRASPSWPGRRTTCAAARSRTTSRRATFSRKASSTSWPPTTCPAPFSMPCSPSPRIRRCRTASPKRPASRRSILPAPPGSAIAAGQRADLLRVGFVGGQPFLRGVWRAGERVA